MKTNYNPGFKPVEYRVLIAPEETETVTKGGIILPDNEADRMQHAQTKGVLVARGGKAFGDWPLEEIEVLEPGARVIYAKYAGTTVKGADGVEYRLVNDKDISAVVTA